MKNRSEVLSALAQFSNEVHTASGVHETLHPGTAAALPANFNPSKALTNLSIIVGAIAPFIPAPVGPILTAIDEALGKLQVGGQAPQ